MAKLQPSKQVSHDGSVATFRIFELHVSAAVCGKSSFCTRLLKPPPELRVSSPFALENPRLTGHQQQQLTRNIVLSVVVPWMVGPAVGTTIIERNNKTDYVTALIGTSLRSVA